MIIGIGMGSDCADLNQGGVTDEALGHLAGVSVHPPDHDPHLGKRMMANLDGVRVAILVTDGFEQSELEKPREALDAEGAETKVVSPLSKPKGWSGKDWGRAVAADVSLADANADEFDALLLPGGVHNPDALRIIPEAVAFVKAFFDADKPVAAICHGPWIVLEAGAARGKRMTSWPSLKTDLTNAGAEWVEEEVVVDGNLITSRQPDDIPAFNREILAAFAPQPVGV